MTFVRVVSVTQGVSQWTLSKIKGKEYLTEQHSIIQLGDINVNTCHGMLYVYCIKPVCINDLFITENAMFCHNIKFA